MLAGPLFAGLLGIIELSYKSLQQTELDNALNAIAGRMSINNFDSSDSIEYLRDEFCPDVGTTFLKCSQLELGIEVLVNDFHTYRNTNIVGTWNMGCTNDPIMIELNYPVTNAVHPIVIADIVQRGDDNYFRSRTVIRREPLLTGSGSC